MPILTEASRFQVDSSDYVHEVNTEVRRCNALKAAIGALLNAKPGETVIVVYHSPDGLTPVPVVIGPDPDMNDGLRRSRGNLAE